MSIQTPIIAIVGRPNVGKSTLFNKVVGSNLSVVEDLPGVTRDRNYALVEKFDFPFWLVDTGGFEKETEEELVELTVEQTKLAAEEADVIIALFDSSSGTHPSDADVVEYLRSLDKKAYFVANKCDGDEQAPRAAEFYTYGLDEVNDLSAKYGRGVSNFIDRILAELPNSELLRISHKDKKKAEKERREELDHEIKTALQSVSHEVEDENEEEFEEEVIEEKGEASFTPVFTADELGVSKDEYIKQHKLAPLAKTKFINRDNLALAEEAEGDEATEIVPQIECIKVAIIGRPNVGKSTLLNTLLGERRAITSSISGTTRDSLNVELTRDGQKYQIIDTAGLRKKNKISDRVERYSTLRTLRAISDADVAVLLIDAIRGPEEQDAKIIGMAHELGKGIIIAVNKWDLKEKDHLTVKKFTDDIKHAFKFAQYAPIVFISALSGKRCPRIIETVKNVAEERAKRISTGKLNNVLSRAMSNKPPAHYRGRLVKLIYATQVDVSPPRFALFFNYPRGLHFSYLRYLKNVLRDKFQFEGTDLKLVSKKRH